MMTQINESVSVDLLSNHKTGRVYPWVIAWRGRKYKITNTGLHHHIRDGRTLCHVFSVTDGNMYFKVVLNTETLQWKLLETGDFQTSNF